MGVTVINFFGGVVALSISLGEAPSEMILAAPAGANADSNPGEIDITAVASGGTLPHAYAWTVTEVSDSASCISILAAGTQNVARYDSLTLRSLTQAGAPTNGEYRLTCRVTDAVGDYEEASVTFDIVSLGL